MDKKELSKQGWFQSLVDDCDGLITETVFCARQELLKGYHALGNRILEEQDNLEKAGLSRGQAVQRIAEATKKSRRTIYYAIEFAEKYPDMSVLPEGKNISWHKVCTKLLPGKIHDCAHTDIEQVVVTKKVCKCCGKEIKDR